MSSYMGDRINASIKGLDLGLTFYDSKFFCLGNMDCRVLLTVSQNRELLYQYPCDIVMNLEVCRYC